MGRPLLKYGLTGSDVELVQTVLAVPIDGDFGSITQNAVQRFQSDQNLTADGIVGENTWDALDKQYSLPPYPPPLIPVLDDDTIRRIVRAAADSAIAQYEWKDRGIAPLGYTKGMALAWSTVYRKFLIGDASVLQMARAKGRNADTDALTWYDGIFIDCDMLNDFDGVDTLRHLFVLLMGLGMRESSGVHCEGRDMSADNVTSDTAEAGLFQMSWNASTCSTDMQKLFDAYSSIPELCALSTFQEGVTCTPTDWECYGEGSGRNYQRLCKACPQFAIEAAAIGLRNLRQHWGPINRYEAEVRPEADEMFQEVRRIVIFSLAKEA